MLYADGEVTVVYLRRGSCLNVRVIDPLKHKHSQPNAPTQREREGGGKEGRKEGGRERGKREGERERERERETLSLIHISEPTRRS